MVKHFSHIFRMTFIVLILIVVAGCSSSTSPTSTSFSGTYINEYPTDYATLRTDVIRLTQNGSSLAGTFEVTAYSDCCRVTLTAPLTGRVSGPNVALISRPYQKERCDGGGGCWLEVWVNEAVDELAQISNDGNTLTFWDDVYVRQ